MAKNILMVIAQKNFRDEELNVPQSVFIQKGAKVFVAAPEKKQADGMLGAVAHPDYSIDEAATLKFDALVLVGGAGAPEYLWDSPVLQTMVRTQRSSGGLLGAICLAPVVLARAGVLSGKEATVYKTQQTLDELKKHGVKMIYRDVVVSGSIVTANGPASAREFALAICELF